MRSKGKLVSCIIITAMILASCSDKPASSKSNNSDNSMNSSSSVSSSEVSDIEVSSKKTSITSSKETISSKQIISSEKKVPAKPKPPSTSKTTPTSKTTTTSKVSKPTGFTWDKGGSFTGAINIHMTSSPKATVLGDTNTMIDISNVSDGYITASHQGSSQRLKLQIIKGQKTYNYDLNNMGNEEVFPLQMGSGDYQVRVMENVTGSQYVQLFTETVSVQLNNDFSPFLYPSQYVNYDESSSAVKKSYDLCMNSKTDLDKVKTIYNYIIGAIDYDYVKAKNVKSGYLPNVDSTLATGKGICFDYAALMATMLRAQNVPTKLVIGNVAPNDISHSWNDVYIKGKGWITVGISSDGSRWKRLDSTFGASNQAKIEEFIGNGANYTVIKIY